MTPTSGPDAPFEGTLFITGDLEADELLDTEPLDGPRFEAALRAPLTDWLWSDQWDSVRPREPVTW